MEVSRFSAAACILAALGLALLAGTDSRGPFVGFVDGAARIGFWAIVFASCARLAARVVRSRLTGLSHFIWDGASGLAMLMALLLAVGLLPGGFRVAAVRGVVATVIAAGALLALSDTESRFRASGKPDGESRWILMLLLAVAIAGLLWNRVPPVFFDARAYHFALPELWLVTGRVAPESWSLLSWFPPGMSMLYGVGLATGGEPWANDANLLVGLCLIAATFDLGRRLFGPAAGLLAGAFATALPLILYALAIPGADLAHGLFVFGSLGCLLLRSAENSCWLRRAGLLAAGACLTKYLGLMVPLALGAVWIGARLSTPAPGRSRRDRIRDAGRFVAPAAIVLVPWLAANAILVGNPVAPSAASLFPTRGLAPGWDEAFQRDTRGGLPGWSDVRSLPPRWFTGSPDDARFYPTPAWGWFAIVPLPFALYACRRDRALRWVLGSAVILLALWFATYRWERFLVAAASLVAVASAGGIVAASRRRASLRWLPVLAAFAAAVSALPSLTAIARFNGGLRVALGRESAAEFLEGGLASVRLFRRANDQLDPDRDRVLLVGEMRHYGLTVPHAAPTGFNTHPLVEALRGSPDGASVHGKLRRQGFTHVIVDPGWIVRSAARYPSLSYFANHPDAAPAYFHSLGAPVAVEGGVALYKIPE